MRDEDDSEPRPVLVIGLGNPGSEYARTRHNVGFQIVDRLLDRLGRVEPEILHRSELFRTVHETVAVHLLKPGTFMNLSGFPVAEAVARLGVTDDRLLVVYDDVDLPLGRIRFRGRGSSGGHRGLTSIIEHLGRGSFHRLKVGIGRPEDEDVVDHVLQPFDAGEIPAIEAVYERASLACLTWIADGLVVAMDRYNALPLVDPEAARRNENDDGTAPPPAAAADED